MITSIFKSKAGNIASMTIGGSIRNTFTALSLQERLNKLVKTNLTTSQLAPMTLVMAITSPSRALSTHTKAKSSEPQHNNK